jgi:hypothetical protein
VRLQSHTVVIEEAWRLDPTVMNGDGAEQELQ